MKNWTLGNIYEDTSLHYYKIENGRQVKVQKLDDEITVAYNTYSDQDNTPQKASATSISCIQPNRNKDHKLQGKTITPKDQLQPLITKYIPPHLKT